MSTLLLSAQEPAPTNPSFQVSVNLVQVDAVVNDSKGHAVRDLRRDDFEILEDGKPQAITHFSWIDVAPPPAASPELPAPKGAPSGPAGAPPARTAQKQDIRRDIVLMVDDASLKEEDLTPILSDMHKFVIDQVQSGDEIAVTASRGGMGFYARFTNDKRQMHAAIDHISQRRGYGMWNLPTPLRLDDHGKLVPLVNGGHPWGYRDDDNPPNPVGYLMWAIQGLQNMPGRKAVVLFSGHTFAAPPALVNLANRAGVVIYVIDPTGVPPMVAFSGPAAPGTVTVGDPYRLLAEKTGGLWIRSVPGKQLTEDLGRVLDDMSGYYLIGYQPDRSDFDLVKGRAVHHDIQIKVRRAGLTVRARNGFLGVPDSPAPAAKPEPRTDHEYLQEALASPFAAGPLRLRIDPLYEATLPDSKTKRRQAILRAMLQVDGNDLKFVPDAPGKDKLTYSVLVGVFSQDGNPVRSGEHTYTADVTPEEEARLKVSGLHMSADVPLPMAGAYQIRAAVRDENSGDVGSAYSFLDVPDFNKPQLTLSSIELSSAKSSKSDLSSWAQFATGAAVEFQCDVFGVRSASQPPQEPRVEMEVRLFRDGVQEPVFDSKVLPVSEKTLAKNYLDGQMRIGKEIEPGDYTMQLIVYDRLAPQKKQSAVQWTNLTVVKPATP